MTSSPSQNTSILLMLSSVVLFAINVLIIRGLMGGFGILSFYITVVHLGAGRSVIINLSSPMFGSLFAAIWLKEFLPLHSWLWMLAGFSGLVIFLEIDLHAGVNLYELLGAGLTLFATWRIVSARDRPAPLPVTTCS